MSQCRSLSIETRLHAGRPWFDFRQGQRFFLLATASRPALAPNRLSIQWVPGALSPVVKRPGREDYTHLHLCVQVKKN
jgi:hypothetical protein